MRTMFRYIALMVLSVFVAGYFLGGSASASDYVLLVMVIGYLSFDGYTYVKEEW